MDICIPYGYRWTEGRLQFNAEWVEEDKDIPMDKHTCNIIVQLANSINPSIQFMGDIASDYTEGYVPILDISVHMVKIGVPENSEDGTPADSYQNIEYRFYKKPMARKTVMMANSAMPESIKRETLVNEMVRRISNTSVDHPNNKTNVVMAVNDYMVALKRSGYPQRVRKEVAIAGFKTFNRKLREAKEQRKPLFYYFYYGHRNIYAEHCDQVHIGLQHVAIVTIT